MHLLLSFLKCPGSEPERPQQRWVSQRCAELEGNLWRGMGRDGVKDKKRGSMPAGQGDEVATQLKHAEAMQRFL